MIADLDTLLTALYVELTGRIIPGRGFTRRGPGSGPEVTDAELICTCDGTVTGFGLANPKLYGEREAARQMLSDQPANRPAPGTTVVTDKGLSGEDTEEFFSSDDLQLTLIRRPQGREAAPPVPELAAAAR